MLLSFVAGQLLLVGGRRIANQIDQHGQADAAVDISVESRFIFIAFDLVLILKIYNFDRWK